MFCRECGTENRNDRKFCSNCGTKLKDYTKPAENLIYPEEIEEKKQIVKKKNKVNLILKIIASSFFIIALLLSIVSFFFKENIVVPITIVALSCYALAFVVFISNVLVAKNMAKKLKQDK